MLTQRLFCSTCAVVDVSPKCVLQSVQRINSYMAFMLKCTWKAFSLKKINKTPKPVGFK